MKRHIRFLFVTLLLITLFTGTVSAEEAASTGEKIILFTKNSIESTAEGVLINGSEVTISGDGEYILRGESDNARLTILTGGKEPVTLILDNIKLKSAEGPVILAESKRVVLLLNEGTENLLADAANRPLPTDDTPAACVYGRNHLAINGTGSLTINARIGRGVQCKDTLTISGGTIEVTSEKDALRANDGITMLDGNVTLNTAKNGMQTENNDDGKGSILLEGGTLLINSGKSAFNAVSSVQISGCSVVLYENTEEE